MLGTSPGCFSRGLVLADGWGPFPAPARELIVRQVFATVPLLVLSEAGGSERGSARSHQSQLNAAPEEAMHMRHQDLSWQRVRRSFR